jgi:predicted component of type VI protein secretion system
VYNLKNVNEVFAHFQPDLEVELADGEGSPVNETFQFRNLSDFGKRSLINQSKFLQELNAQTDTYQKLAKLLKSNKILKSALENTEAKKSYLAALQSLIDELEAV